MIRYLWYDDMTDNDRVRIDDHDEMSIELMILKAYYVHILQTNRVLHNVIRYACMHLQGDDRSHFHYSPLPALEGNWPRGWRLETGGWIKQHRHHIIIPRYMGGYWSCDRQKHIHMIRIHYHTWCIVHIHEIWAMIGGTIKCNNLTWKLLIITYVGRYYYLFY